ncbi:MAG: ATP-binding cassette domain-containing protein [Methanobacterium sp.]
MTVKIENLSKSYGKIRALNEVNLEISKGEIFVLLGANGSGKSTLLKTIATLYSPDQGQISILEKDGIKESSKIKSQIGVLFDNIIHWEKLTGYENAWFFARSYGLSRDKTRSGLDELFTKFNLFDNRDDPVSTYSYGMRRKLALIETLVHKPKLLLLDEPSMGLDYISRLVLYDLINKEIGNDTTVIIATNDVSEATTLAQRVALMQKGNILAVGSPSELIDSVKNINRIDIHLASPMALDDFNRIEGVEFIEINDSDRNNIEIQFLVWSDPEILSNIVNRVVMKGGSILGIEVHKPSLEDVFLRFAEV